MPMRAGETESGTGQTASRRDVLQSAGLGLSGVVLPWLLAREAGAAPLPAPTPARPYLLPEPRVKRVVQVFLTGGVSQVDTFDYKPELQRRHGEPLAGVSGSDTFQAVAGNLLKSPWEFRRRGQSGHWCSELLPHLADCVDDLTFLHGMTARSANHGPAQLQMMTGFVRNGFPCMGSWLTYALGETGRNLPFFVVLRDPRGTPAGGSATWGSGFLPASTQGTALLSGNMPIANLKPPDGVGSSEQAGVHRAVQELNRAYTRRYPVEDAPAARVEAYELAARLQLSVPGVVDLARESASAHSLYGTDDPVCGEFARNCLLARRLLEQGVPFVQLYQGGSAMKPRVNWDAHEDVLSNHSQEARIMDRPVAALIRDLKQRGMLADTLLLWVTEFGRTPYSQGPGKPGRDHNPLGFTIFGCGAGLKPGSSHGATDEFGHRAVTDVTTIYDFHATVLHLLGIDHTRLTYYHNGIRRRLTDVHGHVIRPILA